VLWVETRTPVSTLVADIVKTRQFSIHVRCQPDEVKGVAAPIVSICQPGGLAEIEIRQEGTHLALWFRNPLSIERPSLAWHTPAVFTPKEPRD
jgi:hypothetical protein